MNKWDDRFLTIARTIASWSKDPSRQVGCVVIDDDRNQLSSGYNGFPRGISDDLGRLSDRSQKLRIIVHAEANAVAAAARNGHSLKGGTIYVTMRPCCQCASLLIQAGIKQVVTPVPIRVPDWEEDFRMAEYLLHEAGVSYIYA